MGKKKKKCRRLQEGYTTQEQSEQLMKWGVPRWTADGAYNKTYDEIHVVHPDCQEDEFWKVNPHLSPRWSNSRLMEICDICYFGNYKDPSVDHSWSSYKHLMSAYSGKTYTEYIMYVYYLYINLFDFSALLED